MHIKKLMGEKKMTHFVMWAVSIRRNVFARVINTFLGKTHKIHHINKDFNSSIKIFLTHQCDIFEDMSSYQKSKKKTIAQITNVNCSLKARLRTLLNQSINQSIFYLVQ